MKNLTWLAINYNLPSEPSRIRVAAWRNLKKLGAVSLQQSMWILPYNGDNRKALEEMVKDMEREGGEAFIMQSSFINEKDENI